MGNNVVILFGYSGSLKSEMAKSIGEKYGLRIIHPPTILRELYHESSAETNTLIPTKGFWESEEGIKLSRLRLKEDSLDLKLDEMLLEEIRRGNVVMDSYTMPWLTKEGIKINLRLNLQERANRVARQDNFSPGKIRKLIKENDSMSRRIFRNLYDFDIMEDLDVFDYAIRPEHGILGGFNKICNYLNRMGFEPVK